MIISNFKYFTMPGLIVIFLVSINVAQAEDNSATQEVIPPAPLGPYVSTGLLESEADTPATKTPAINTPVTEAMPEEVVPAQNLPVVTPQSGDDKGTDDKKASVTKPAVQVGTSKMPMEAFSPDIPWPADMRPPLSQSSARRMSEQVMSGYGSRQPGTKNRGQQNGQQQHNNQQQGRPSFNQAPAANNAGYPGRFTVPQAANQAANQQMQKMSNTGQPGFRHQMPNGYIPKNNFPSAYPAGNMPNPYYYQPGYTN